MRLFLFLFLSLCFLSCEKKHSEITESQVVDQSVSKVVRHPLTVERIFSSPNLDGETSQGVKISPDGRYVTFLKGKEKNFKMKDLWCWDFKTKKKKRFVDFDSIMGGQREALSDEEKALRERKRISSSGIVSYFWSDDSSMLMFPINGDIYIYHLKTSKVERLTQTKAAELDPKFSPQGKYVSFVRNNNIFVMNIKTKLEVALTQGGTSVKPFGRAEFVAQEEMGRYTGYWWAPDDSSVAFIQYDESRVGRIKRFEFYPQGLEIIEQTYPMTGSQNVTYKLGAVRLSDKKINWIQLPKGDIYIPHVQWAPYKDELTLSYQVQSRDQKALDVWFYDVKSKTSRKMIEERDRAWVNIYHDMTFFKKEKKFLWRSERSGFANIYLYSLAKGLLRKTPLVNVREHSIVTHILGLDERNKKVYYQGQAFGPSTEEVMAVGFDSNQSESQRVTDRSAGTHQGLLSVEGGFLVDHFSNYRQPLQTKIISLTGQLLGALELNEVKPGHPLYKYRESFSKWEEGSLTFKDRKSHPPIYYRLLKPRNFSKEKKYPLVQMVYGGPGKQMVKNEWGGRFGYIAHLLSQKGYLILAVDNRGTPGLGRDFERSIYKKFGALEVEDQVYALKKIIEKGFVDKGRIGVFGHSYGGYLTLMLMMQSPDLYKVGVSGAPVTDWALYDTHYTERYIGKPQEEKAVYRQANVLTHVKGLRGRLLLMHGMADDNVLYSHSTALYKELQAQGKLFDIMAYPGAKHGIRDSRETKIHHMKTLIDYFQRHL